MSNALCWLWQDDRRTGAHRDGTAAAGVDLTSLRALVVDDLPVHRLLLSGMLKVLFPRAQVDVADDGTQAQVLLDAQHYDIVLSDWFMPGVDGLQLANWLRSGERRKLPFVLFSANDMVDEIAPLFDTHGIDGYLIKPFDKIALKEVIEVAVGALTPVA